jgi:glycosyltransferase involved in cell wall biosynthesis
VREDLHRLFIMGDAAYRVLVFGTAFPPSAVGTGAYAYCLARGLCARGGQVQVLAPEEGECTSFDREQPFEVVRMPWTAWVPGRYLVARRWLGRVLDSLKPDCLWTTNGMATRVAGLLGKGRGVPVVSSLRGSDIVTRLPGKGIWPRLESIPQRRCYARSAAIAAASSYLKEVAVAKGVDGERIFVNPPVFDFESLREYCFDPQWLWRRYPALQGKRLVLTVARLVEQKRVHLALRALGQIAGDFPDLHYAIVGDGPQKGALERLIGELGLADRVLLTGLVPPMSAQLFDLYSGAQVFLLPSVCEGMGHVFVEAGAFGLPSVGVADGGVPEVIAQGETGLLGAVDEVDGLADNLRRLLKDESLRLAMGRKARQRVATQFSLPAMAERSYGALQRVIGGRPWP